jgi:HEAT repeat protein
VLIRQLRTAKKSFQRAAAYALGGFDSAFAISHPERSLKDVKESARVRGQVAETLAMQKS